MCIFLSTILAIAMLISSGCAKKEEAAKSLYEERKAATIREEGTQAQKIDKPIYTFERDLEGWEIPDWALEKEDHVAKAISLSKDFSREGSSSLKIDVDFPGKVWTAGLVEVMQYLDLGPYKEISCDIYLPKPAPDGLKAKLILTVGDDWKFTEMARSVTLMPGEWVTVRADISGGSEDWKATTIDDSFRRDVRKIVIRIESNRSPVYAGPIYIDNIRVSN